MQSFLVWFILALTIVVVAVVWKKNQTKQQQNDPWWLARKDCQFRHFFKGTGVALDTANRVIFLKNKSLEKSYSFDDIRNFKYNVSSGGQIIGGKGLQAAAYNIRVIKENDANSGLFITIRDIDNPQWKIAFPYNGKIESELLRWMEIFRQYVNNE